MFRRLHDNCGQFADVRKALAYCIVGGREVVKFRKEEVGEVLFSHNGN